MVHITSVLQEHEDRDVAHHDLGRAGSAVPVPRALNRATTALPIAVGLGTAISCKVVSEDPLCILAGSQHGGETRPELLPVLAVRGHGGSRAIAMCIEALSLGFDHCDTIPFYLGTDDHLIGAFDAHRDRVVLCPPFHLAGGVGVTSLDGFARGHGTRGGGDQNHAEERRIDGKDSYAE